MENYMSNNIAILTHVDDNFIDIEKIVKSNHLEYSNHNHHEYIRLSTKDIINHFPVNKEIYWLKIIAVLNTLKSRRDIDWIFMVDIDCVFNKKNIPLSTFTSSANKNHDILLCCMESNMIQNYWNINIGAMFFRNTIHVYNILTSMIDYAKSLNFTIFEQQLFQLYLRNNTLNILQKTGFFPEHAFNHGSNNTFLYHACGSSTSSMDFNEALKIKMESLKIVINDK